ASTAIPTTTTPSKNTIALAQSLRALNASFLSFVKESIEKDPFVDFTNVVDKYRSFYNQVLEKEKGAVDVLRERDVNKSNTPTAASTTVTSGGFSFGGASTTTSSSTGGFSFNPASPTSSTSNPTTSSVGPNWECGTCLASNPSGKEKCVCCEAAKPGNAKSSSTTPAPVHGSFSFGGASSATIAPPSTGGFTFGKASSSASAVATTDSFTFGVSASPAAAPKPSAIVASGPNWECDTCLVSNPSDKVKCMSCEAVKPENAKASSTTPAPVSGGFSFGGASTSTPSTTGGFSFGGDSSAAPKPATPSRPNWECGTCLVSNPSDKVKCMACEAAKPGNAKVSSTTPAPASGGFSIGGASSSSSSTPAATASGGFTFGGAPTSNPAPSTSGFSFGKSATAIPPILATISKPAVASGPNWECDTCLVSNPSDKVKCMSCEATKPGNAKASSTTPGSGFSFGNASATTSAPTATATSGFSFKPATTEEKPKSPVKASGGFSFGGGAAASVPTSGGFSFGATPSTAALAATGGFSFGSAAPASTTSTFSGFGSLAAPTAPTTTTTATPSFGGFSGFGGLSSNPSTIAPAETTNGDDDDEPTPDEQIDQETLMRGAGEESEQTLYSVLTRAHVYDAANKKWADVGKGILKINQNPETKKSRLILRADGSGRVLLNVAVFSGMGVKVETAAKSVSFMAVGEGAKLNKYLVKVKDIGAAQALCGEIEKVVKTAV
ncbi:UNVERIFIED_CONTAM: hypothetical protein HDU68_000814, partial [Siphonaria sp. JEL0065]